MSENLKEVSGGWSLFIPTEVARKIGLTENAQVEVRLIGEELVLCCPEFVGK